MRYRFFSNDTTFFQCDTTFFKRYHFFRYRRYHFTLDILVSSSIDSTDLFIFDPIVFCVSSIVVVYRQKNYEWCHDTEKYYNKETAE
jgi:hypothetical protein